MKKSKDRKSIFEKIGIAKTLFKEDQLVNQKIPVELCESIK